MHDLIGESSISVRGGCYIHCSMGASDEANLTVGDSPHTFQLTFDFETFRDVIAQGSKVLAEMDAKADEEAAEWEAAQRG